MIRIAIPVVQGELSAHFGHCEAFELMDVDEDKGSVVGRETATAPDHQPGLLPRWLADRGAKIVIAGGMGRRAQDLFSEQGIKVLIGASREAPDAIVAKYLDGTLTTGDNICDH